MTDISRMADRLAELEERFYLTDDEVINLYLYIQNQYIDRSDNSRIPYNGHIVTTMVTRLSEYYERIKGQGNISS